MHYDHREIDLLRQAGAAASGLRVGACGLVKRFGARQVLHGLDLDIEAGSFVAVVGRSGCGKTSLLRLLAGLDAASEGSLLLDGEPAGLRRDDVRLMFQDARLLPWRTVAENVAIGLPGVKREIRRQALAALAEVGLADRADEWPARLSGGQRQRVALARALIHRPRLLLLDEPLGALDALTRIEMQRLIERLWQQHRFTAVLVTHDVSEAVALGDRILLVEEGRITLDEPVPLGRPREHGEARFAQFESRVLRRLTTAQAIGGRNRIGGRDVSEVRAETVVGCLRPR